jgi:hypothetical protein
MRRKPADAIGRDSYPIHPAQAGFSAGTAGPRMAKFAGYGAPPSIPAVRGMADFKGLFRSLSLTMISSPAQVSPFSSLLM